MLKVTLSVDTNPNLYDQKLTLVIPMANTNGAEKVMQDQEQIYDIHLSPSELLINIKPINSNIYVHYN
ncbi:MAG: hypothetical protein GY797_11935 [Deltaproteobacteria bacterium]|nr:hypothetical protein [Deltaproteobacteria bacterium]